MASRKKETREEQYRRLLSERGIDLNSCKVLAYSFLSNRGPHLLHFDLMTNCAGKYVLFDASGDTAHVVIRRDDAIADTIDTLARHCGGEPRLPNLRG